MTDREAKGGTLIAGGGFAGSYVARLLGRSGATIVNPGNFMLFTPLRVMCPHTDLLLGRVVAHDGERRRVQIETEERVFWLGYSNLVVALGAVARTLPIPGLAEHALGFKSLADAIHLRNHVLTRLEVAAAATTEAHRLRELTFVFVGAGYAGVQALAELADLVRDALSTTLEAVEPHAGPVGRDAAPDEHRRLDRRRHGTSSARRASLPLDDRDRVRVRVDETLRVEGAEEPR